MLIKKWFNMLASDKTPGENLKSLLRPYEIMIDKRLYETLIKRKIWSLVTRQIHKS